MLPAYYELLMECPESFTSEKHRKSDAVHRVEKIRMLDADRDTDLFSDLIELVRQCFHIGLCLFQIYEHDHREDVIQDRLGDIVNIDVFFRKKCGDLRDDSHRITADDRDHCLILILRRPAGPASCSVRAPGP